jgi:5-methylcytosine-specific restriction endonuclease McrA
MLKLVYEKGTTKIWSRVDNPVVLIHKKAKQAAKRAAKKSVPVLTFYRDANAVSKPDRLNFLKGLANKGGFVSKKVLGRLRKNFEETKKSVVLSQTVCYVCSGRSDHRHHVVPLSRGGTNDKRNIVTLCNHCHEQVHPWLNCSKEGDGDSQHTPCYAFTRGVAPAV